MQARSRSRGIPGFGSSCVVALVMHLVCAAYSPVQASLAPPTPTFTMKWGSGGNAPGQFGGSPRGIAFDSQGNVYTCDPGNDRIQKFDALGNFITQWGSFGTGNGQFINIWSIAIDDSDNVYVVELGNSRVQKFTVNGTFLTKWPVPGPASGIAIKPGGNVCIATTDGINVYSSMGALLGGLSPAAPFHSAIAFDHAGNLYVAHFDTLWKYTPNGGLLWKMATPGHAHPDFVFVTGIAVDGCGNLYVAENGIERIQKISSSGTFLGQWGVPGTGDAQFTGLFSVGVNPMGDVYVTDDSRIQKFSGAGNPLSFPPAFYWQKWGGSGEFNGPSGIAMVPWTNYFHIFYVVDSNNNRINRYALSDGALLEFGPFGSAGTGNGQFQLPWGITTDPFGKVYVTDVQNFRVQKFSTEAVYQRQWGSNGAGPGQFYAPTGIAADSFAVYVVDAGTSRVQKFDLNGVFITSWGSTGSGPGQFSFPLGIAVDGAGLVYVADNFNNRIQKFTRTGTYLGEWGSFGTGPGEFNSPSGVRVDRYGNVVVTDSGNNRVQMFTSNGTFLTQWGSAGSGNGQFNNPLGVCTDAAGNVFVTDANNHRVQEFAFPPRILMVSDILKDQGGKVRVRFARSTVDAFGIQGGLLYSYRTSYRNDSNSDWQVAVESFASAEPEYSVIATVPITATASNWFFTNFRVQTFIPGIPPTPVDGGSESGFAVDNLTPPPPTAFTVAVTHGSTHLSWSPSAAPDFTAFRLHRGTNAGFQPSADNLVVETSGTSYLDPSTTGMAYKLCAVDRNGNESEYALASGGIPGTGGPARLALRGALQNPTPADRFVVSFSLAATSPAQLEMYDVTGRCVLRRHVGGMGPGWHDVRLTHEGRIAAGIYHLRLSQDGQTKTARVAVVH